MTYQELYEAIGKLTPEQRQQEVSTCEIDRNGVTIGDLWVVEVDQINPSGDGMEPISNYDGSDPGFEIDPDFDWQSEPVVCKAGTVLLMEKE